MIKRFPLEKLFQTVIILFFLVFLFLPLLMIIWQALVSEGKLSLHLFYELFQDNQWLKAFGNSLSISILVAVVTTFLGFLLAYGMNFTDIPPKLKRLTNHLLVLPMLLPTITYGFVLIYSFGKQGLWSKVFQKEWFSIYGMNGVVIGLVIYALPVTFLLMNDAMQYIDKRFMVVSRLMEDSFWRGLKTAILQPLTKVFGVALVQSFFMSFTDFGIPTAVGGQNIFVTTLLYDYFMGAVPDFSRGAVIALTMLLPSVLSILLLRHLQKKDTFYDQKSLMTVRKNRWRDGLFMGLFLMISLTLIAIFAIMLVIPFLEMWPYQLNITLTHFLNFFAEPTLLLTLRNGVFVGFLTAVVGTLFAYLAAVLTARSSHKNQVLKWIDHFSMITNSIPGMVLGISYLLVFRGTLIHNTFLILVAVNVIHYFSTPYQMAKSALQKMNKNWENTGKMMGDRWQDTLWRVVIPNSKVTILEMFSYYFTNAMVTISAVVFLTSANTMVMTTKIKELQHFGRFTDIFILSLLLLLINLSMRLIIQTWIRRIQTNEKRVKKNFIRAVNDRFSRTSRSM